MTITREDLLAKSERRGECLVWQGCRSGEYGTIWDLERHRMIYVHRAMIEILHGPIPNRSVVMHSCDNPPCLEPSHLSVGSQSENLIDAARKGRAPGQKLTPSQANEIRLRYHRRGNVSNIRDLAEEYGVSRNTILNVVNGATPGLAA